MDFLIITKAAQTTTATTNGHHLLWGIDNQLPRFLRRFSSKV